MAIRLIECQRILKRKGSIYLHCDPNMSHYLKTTMNCIFGEDAFQTDIRWKRTFAHSDRAFSNTSDQLLLYGSKVDVNANIQFYRFKDEIGVYRLVVLTGPKVSSGESGATWHGYTPGDFGRGWSVPKTGGYAKWIEENFIPNYRSVKGILTRLDLLEENGFIHHKAGGAPRLKWYLKPSSIRLSTAL